MQIETRAIFGDAFIKGLTAKLFDIQNQADMAYSLAMPTALGVEANTATALFVQESSDQARETIAGKTGIGYLSHTKEGEDYASDSRISTYETVFNFQKYTSGITITEDDRDDRIVDAKLSEARDLLVGGKQTQNKHAFDLFNKAFTPQASLPEYLTYYSDGVPSCSTIHPLKGVAGQTQSNASDTSIPLTEANLEIARTALRRQLDDRGLPMAIGSGREILLVPDALEKLAVIITKSTKRSGTDHNDMNIYDGIITVISTKWINAQNGGLDTQWFLIDSMHSPVIFFNRKPLTLGKPYITDSNKNITVDISTRYQVGNKDFRGMWGSKGDGSGYAL